MSSQQNHPYEGDPTSQLAARMGNLAMREEGYSTPQHAGIHSQSPTGGQIGYPSLPTPTNRPGPQSPYTDQQFPYYPSNIPVDPNYSDQGMSLVDPATYNYGTNLLDQASIPMQSTASYNTFQPPIDAYTSQASLTQAGRVLQQTGDSAPLTQSAALVRQPYRPPHLSLHHQQSTAQQQGAYQQQINAAAITSYYPFQEQNPCYMGQTQAVYLPQSAEQKQDNQRSANYQARRQHSSINVRPSRQNPSTSYHVGNYPTSPAHGTFMLPSPLTSSYPGTGNNPVMSFGLHHSAPYAGFPSFGQNSYHRGNLTYSMRPRRMELIGTIRSALLEDFRLNKLKRWQLTDVFGHIVEFASDQHGSRFIQQKFEQANEEEREKIFQEILPDAFQVMTDVFGNYVTQKLFEEGTEVQKLALAKKMEGRVVQLSMQMYGCRVVQKALENLSPDARATLVSELEPHILICVKSANANHVIQRLIVLGPPQSVPDAFVGHVEELSKHPYGCRVLQKTFENLNHDMTEPLFEELQQLTVELMKDQFGNYVVQSVILTSSTEDRAKIIEDIKGNILGLARHKFASNVLEKAITSANAQDRQEIIAELVGVNPDGTSNVGLLLRDAYGNFPLQTSMLAADHAQRQEIIDLITPVLPQIRHTPVGKRIESRLAQLGPEGFNTGLRMSISSADTSETNGLSVSRTASSSSGPTSPEPSSTSTARGPVVTQKTTASPQAANQEAVHDAKVLEDLLH